MRILTLAAAIATALSLPAGIALASGGPALTEAAQATLTEQLVADGYEVRRFDTEDGLIEVYAVKDGKMVELYFDADLNLVRSSTDS